MSVTLIIIVLTAAVSIPSFSNKALFYKLDFSPFQIETNKEWYRFLSHAFVHADWFHLLMNMLVLYFFGDITQNYFEAYKGNSGVFYFIMLYVGGIIVASISDFYKNKNFANYHSVGASGAVSAILFSSVYFSPATDICLYGLLCFPGIAWAILYLIYSYKKSKDATDYINHGAHFWGAIYGIVYSVVCVPDGVQNFFYQLKSIFV